jgi:hypothetical protein
MASRNTQNLGYTKSAMVHQFEYGCWQHIKFINARFLSLSSFFTQINKYGGPNKWWLAQFHYYYDDQTGNVQPDEGFCKKY